MKFLLLLTLILSHTQIHATEHYENIFKKHDATGTFVLKNISTQDTKIYNTKRSNKQFVPASTFKIVNSMIALQEGVVKDINDTIKWDGVKRSYAPWNQDHTMKTGIPVSCVWFYQELARKVGKVKIQSWLEKCDYGNKTIDNDVDKFWLEGGLKISAVEQVAFIEKFVKNELPFDTTIQKTVKSIIITDSTENYTVYSKTGWGQKIGWNVGYITTNKETWIFAINIEMNDIKEAKKRTLITYDVLKEEKIIK